MIDSHSLAEYSSQVLNASGDAELEQRLGLYRVFLKLYEHHRGLLDEILDLENTGSRSRNRVSSHYLQGVIHGQHVYLITNLVKGKTQSLLQPQRTWVVGRDRKAALPVQDKRLSRQHAAIQYVEKQGFYLIDLESTNGSFVNGEAVRHCTLLKDGDQVRLGSLAFTFFICRAAKVVEPLPADLLAQVNNARIALELVDSITSESSLPTMTVDWDPPHTGSSDDTSMFLKPPVPVGLPEPPQLSVAQQSDILDRFLKRQLPEICN